MKRIEPIKPFELRLVIEVEPYHWSDRESPGWNAGAESERAWTAYFNACMADANIEGIKPLVPGSMFVDAFEVVRNELILRMIRECLHHSGLPGFPDKDGHENASDMEGVGSVRGGYAVLARDSELFEPQCCCEFVDLKNWKQALIDRPAAGTVYMGHPEAEINFAGELVTVKQGWEGTPPPESLQLFSVSIEELAAAVEKAELERERLTDELRGRVKELFADQIVVEQVVSALMGAG